MCALLVSAITLSGAANVITFTTAKAVGEEVTLTMTYKGNKPKLTGLNGTPTSGKEVTYTLTSQNVTITGDVAFLDCTSNQLTALDVSKNTKLTELYCYKNELTTLALPQSNVLQKLSCHDNQLTALDLSKNTALTMLWCYKNQLTALDVSKNTKLTVLYCGSNKLIALDLSKNIALIEFNCYDNQLTALDVSTNTKLALLYCDRNKLKVLDVSKNTMLTHLQCFENRLTALDLSKNTALASLHCYGNQIKGGEMTRLVNSLPNRTKGIGKLIAVQYPAPEGNICLKSDAAIAAKKNWNTYLYDTQTNEDKLYGGTKRYFLHHRKGGRGDSRLPNRVYGSFIDKRS